MEQETEINLEQFGFENLIKDFKAGEVIFEEGSEPAEIYYTIEGILSIEKDGEEVNRIENTGEFIGEMSFLLGEKRTATVRAVTDTSLVVISKEEFEECLAQNIKYGIELSRILAQRLAHTTKELSKYIKLVHEYMLI